MNRIIYIDPIGGIAGDMLLGALLDGGGDEAYLLEQLKKLNLPGWRWRREQTSRGGFAGTKIDFCPEETDTVRHLGDIVDLVTAAAFPEEAEKRILKTFRLLAEAEAKVHNTTVDRVHFHEVGAVDTILDICGSVLLLERADVQTVVCSPLPMGSGTVRCAHGEIPVPAPAVAELLKGAAVYSSPVRGETVTPTGIALLRAYDTTFGSMPPMTVESVGSGCGSRDGEVPNLCRVFLGFGENGAPAPLCRLECTVDDMTGEELGYLWERIEAAGANDMYYTPVYMKKGRPAVKITVLAETSVFDDVKAALFRFTSTLGMICVPVERAVLERRFTEIDTPWGKVRYKEAAGFGTAKAKAEYEDIRAIAEKTGRSPTEIRRACDALYDKDKDSR